MEYSESEMQNVLDQVKAAESGAFFREEAFRGVLRVDGKDTLELLNRLSSARVDRLKPGEVKETLLTTEKGRVIDAILVVPVDDVTVRILTSAPGSATVREWLEKFTIMEDCVYTDESKQWTQFTVFNLPDEAEGFPFAVPSQGKAEGHWIQNTDTVKLHYASVTGNGLRMLCPAEHADRQREILQHEHSLPALGEHAFTLWRVDQLLPAVGLELAEWSNPLEAGAAAGVDFAKGCFIGQEVIARLENYEKVQRSPVRLRWQDDAPEHIPPAVTLASDGNNAGFVTTHVFDPRVDACRGIGLVRSAYRENGMLLTVAVGDRTYTVQLEC